MLKRQGFNINPTKRIMSQYSNSKGISSNQPKDNKCHNSAEATKR